MSLLAAALALLPLAAAGLLLSSPRAASIGRGIAAAAVLGAAVLDVVLFRSGRAGSSGTFDADPLSLFLTALVLGSLFVTLLSAEATNAKSLARSLIAGALAIVAVSTRDLLWALPAVTLLIVVSRERPSGRSALSLALLLVSLASGAILGWSRGGTDLALLAVAGGAPSLLERVFSFLLAGTLLLAWLFESRSRLRFSSAGLATRMGASFVLLVAVAAVLFRFSAWAPELAPLETIRWLSLLTLAVGALGTIGSTRITTFLTALATARAALVFLSLSGGVHGRAPLLLELLVTGVSLLFVSLALDGLERLDDAVSIRSDGRRLLLLLGALSAASVPPFPGFAASFPLAAALLSEGHETSLAVALASSFVIGVGSMRLLAPAFSGESGTRALSVGREAWCLVLAAAALWFLVVDVSEVFELAARAAMGVF